jgi:hypothetical protein
MSDNPSEFLTIWFEWRPGQRFRKNLHVREKRPAKKLFLAGLLAKPNPPPLDYGASLAKFALLKALLTVLRSLRCRLAQFTKPKN